MFELIAIVLILLIGVQLIGGIVRSLAHSPIVEMYPDSAYYIGEDGVTK
jgi:hypothetical protein